MTAKILYLIPCHLSENARPGVLSPAVNDVLLNTKFFFSEEIRTSRRFISSLKLGIKIDELTFFELDKKTSRSEIKEVLKKIPDEIKEIGVMSEAGCPGIADPGSKLTAIAHEAGWKVCPLTGPSSILLSLMGSGFNGQKFVFHGYLPVNNEERASAIRKIEDNVYKSGTTHIFIETPYRNQVVFAELLLHLRPDTLLCVASDLTGEDETVKTMKIVQWKKNIPQIHKIPTIFLIGTYDLK